MSIPLGKVCSPLAAWSCMVAGVRAHHPAGFLPADIQKSHSPKGGHRHSSSTVGPAESPAEEVRLPRKNEEL